MPILGEEQELSQLSVDSWPFCFQQKLKIFYHKKGTSLPPYMGKRAILQFS
ncbi:MAG: hypothetical protein RI995_1487 [Bacteroidota bacterium]